MSEVAEGFPRLRDTEPKRSKPARKSRQRVTLTTRQQVSRNARGRCEAVLHHDDCPQHQQNATVSEFVGHHVLPKGRGGADTADNLIWVWNEGRIAAKGCHLRIHSYPRVARCLGVLKQSDDDPWFGIGLVAGYHAGFLTDEALMDAGYDPASIGPAA